MSWADSVHQFETREEAAACAAGALVTALAYGLGDNGRAVFMGSGGSSPGPVYQRMSRARIDWSKVTVGLVDERWVDADDAASNEKLLRKHLLMNRASEAQFLPMKTAAASAEAGAPLANLAYQDKAAQPYDAVLLGMGTDGHTASWFPGARGLDKALDPASRDCVSAIDARGCPVAGAHPDRLTLTLNVVKSARTVVLLLFGEEKRGVLEQALTGPNDTLPVSHLIAALDNKLTILWAP